MVSLRRVEVNGTLKARKEELLFQSGHLHPLPAPVGALTLPHPLTESTPPSLDLWGSSPLCIPSLHLWGELTPSHPPAYWICGGANTAASSHCTCWGAFSAMTWLLKADHIVQMLRVVFLDWYPQRWRQYGAGVVEVGVEMGGRSLPCEFMI